LQSSHGQSDGVWCLPPLYAFRSLPQHILLICLFFISGTEVNQSPAKNRMLNFRKQGVEWTNKTPKQSSPFRPWSRWWHLWQHICFPPLLCQELVRNFASGLVVCQELHQNYDKVIC